MISAAWVFFTGLTVVANIRNAVISLVVSVAVAGGAFGAGYLLGRSHGWGASQAAQTRAAAVIREADAANQDADEKARQSAIETDAAIEQSNEGKAHVLTRPEADDALPVFSAEWLRGLSTLK